MVNVSHVVFLDESGLSRWGNSIQSLWVSAAIAIPFERSRELDADVAAVRRASFRARVKELKGHLTKRSELLSGVTPADVAQRAAALVSKFGAHAWVTATRLGCPRPPGFTSSSPQAKEVARQLLLERVNGMLATGRYAPENWLMVWDLSQTEELYDLSAAVGLFANGITGAKIDPRLYPMVLGGLSHDWGGLQLADIYAHFALHKVGVDQRLPDANLSKADAFDVHIEPTLQRSSTGAVVGFKRWSV